MSDLELFIGNKKYSSWSFRPWIALTAKAVDFKENLQTFEDDNYTKFRAFSPSGTVPVLRDDDLFVWESLAILEYLADKFPDRGFWPEDPNARARARSCANEMHGGFSSIRSECPMNMARAVRPLAVSNDVKRDVARIEEIWDNALQTSGGPFLFGDFCNADAMFAPVVNRLEIYCLSEHPAVLAYSDTLKSLPAWKSWETAGRAESWIYEPDEA
ncbi:MAG: glutathione S-transferase family protein [Pseudomonadota bacterium]